MRVRSWDCYIWWAYVWKCVKNTFLKLCVVFLLLGTLPHWIRTNILSLDWKIIQFQPVSGSITKTINAWSLTKNQRIYQACLETTPRQANFMRANTTKAPYLGNLASPALCAKAIWPLYLSPEAAHREGLFAGGLELWWTEVCADGGRRKKVRGEGCVNNRPKAWPGTDPY